MTSFAIDQSRRIAAEMAPWLEVFDRDLGVEDVPLRSRPLQALFKLFENDAIKLEGLAKARSRIAGSSMGPLSTGSPTRGRAEVQAQAAKIASTSRYVEFRRVAVRRGAMRRRQLVVNCPVSLQHAATLMAEGRESERGHGWYDLQMSNEAALKAVLHPRPTVGEIRTIWGGF